MPGAPRLDWVSVVDGGKIEWLDCGYFYEWDVPHTELRQGPPPIVLTLLEFVLSATGQRHGAGMTKAGPLLGDRGATLSSRRVHGIHKYSRAFGVLFLDALELMLQSVPRSASWLSTNAGFQVRQSLGGT